MEKAALAGYPQVARMIYERPWAILPATLAVIEEVISLRLDGYRFTEEEIAERVAAVEAAPARQLAPGGTPGALAVIPLMGVLMPRANLMSAMSGGTSLQGFQARFRDALNSPDVAGILIEVDSPGGSVDLVQETADMVYQARDVKPVVAIANTMAASAGYCIFSQAEEGYVTPSGEVGSIGVRMAHRDVSGALAQAGVTMTEIAAPEFKTEGTPYAPLSDESIAYFQSEVDAVYGEFVAAVARGRNATPETVREDMGRGRMLRADDALAAGMVDGVATFDQAVVRLAQMTRGARGRVALAEFNGALRYGAVKADPRPVLAADGEADANIVWIREHFGPEARKSGDCSCGREMQQDEYEYDGGSHGFYACDNCGAGWTVDVNGAMWPAQEIPEPQVAAGDDGGKPAARARLRGRRI